MQRELGSWAHQQVLIKTPDCMKNFFREPPMHFIRSKRGILKWVVTGVWN